jgi:hypothetical protein
MPPGRMKLLKLHKEWLFWSNAIFHTPKILMWCRPKKVLLYSP